MSNKKHALGIHKAPSMWIDGVPTSWGSHFYWPNFRMLKAMYGNVIMRLMLKDPIILISLPRSSLPVVPSCTGARWSSSLQSSVFASQILREMSGSATKKYYLHSLKHPHGKRAPPKEKHFPNTKQIQTGGFHSTMFVGARTI